MNDLITEMSSKNIGSLCLFLNSAKNIDYLNYLDSNIPIEIIKRNLSEKVYYFINKIKELQLCDCGDHRSYIGFKNGYRSTCGNKKCFVKKRKKTCIQKYGVDNPKKSKSILEKQKMNIEKKWNGKHYMFDKNVKNKFKKTMMKKFGVEWSQQSKSISSKSKETFNNNPQKKEIINQRSKSFKKTYQIDKEKINDKKKLSLINKFGSIEEYYKYFSKMIKENSLIKFGTNHHLSNKEIISKRILSYTNNITNKIIDACPENIKYLNRHSNVNRSDNVLTFQCLDCGNEFEMNRQFFVSRSSSKRKICTICNPPLDGKSNSEIEVLDFIRSIYDGEIISNSKNVIPPNEIDIYLPELNLAFEYNGLYWHSELYKDKKYHLNKTLLCQSKNIDLVHIWEDNWINKKDIIKSIIKNKIISSKTIYARKCEIREIKDNKLVKHFLNENHIQGFVGSKIKLGLFYQNDLVGLMTFGELRKSLGQKSKDNNWELIRFCNKLNISIAGGASKLFNFFIKKYNPETITSFCDISLFNGDLYKMLGFSKLYQSNPNYYWVIDESRSHRFNWRKDKLIRLGYDSKKTEIQIMNDLGKYRIFDCGNDKYLWSKILKINC